MPSTPVNGWPFAGSPFHRGERAVQERAGVADTAEARGRRAIRNFMPDEHRAFFAQLPFVIVGTIDATGQTWASMLSAQPGFVQSPDPHRLVISASALHGDPLAETLRVDTRIALLGIEPHTRRRNRVNGIVEQATSTTFTVRIDRSFGNCPKYIQARAAHFDATRANADSQTIRHSNVLDATMQRLVSTADTFFIASAVTAEDAHGPCPHGVDVSHRGGKPGFVRIDDAHTLTVPDFVGNDYFNTLGNIVLNPHVGLLFIDFVGGDLLYIAADAVIVWDGDALRAFRGAQRLLRLQVKRAVYVERSLPLTWSDAQQSPFLEHTGAWCDTAST